MTSEPKGLSAELRLLILGGFVGAFTTFSTYVFDTFRLFAEAGLPAAASYFVANNLLGLGGLGLGIAIGRLGSQGGLL
jgi:CrcB protein